MRETARTQLNNVIPEATEYKLLPLQFLGKRKEGEFNPFTRENGKALPRADIAVLSLVWTAKFFGKNVKLSNADIARKCGLSKRAVEQSLERLKEKWRVLEEPKDNVYKIIPKVKNKRYIVLENYLHKAKFNIASVNKKLTKTAQIILERIISFYKEYYIDEETGERIYINYNFKSQKIINYFCGSEKSIAKYLNLPVSTVSDGISELIHAKLTYRNKRLKYKDENGATRYKITQERGVTGNTLSLFSVPSKLLLVEQRSTYEAQEPEFIEGIEEIEVSEAEIQAKYADMRAEAKAKAEAARNRAFEDKEMRDLQAELMSASNSSDIDRIQPRYSARLAVLGLSEEELSPQYSCVLCEDTGQNLDTGQRCLCRRKVKQLIIESKKA